MPRYHVATRWDGTDLDLDLARSTKRPDDVIVIPVAELDERIERIYGLVGVNYNGHDERRARAILEA